ncbi:ABC-three component system protein [Flavobacterium sp. SUN046]|uniref:ABC-three component system protein n=1 Tax=Flavobacterium sp. SUN046 TaxID=3002440 RepID=UPI002DBFB3A1|nr:ABC-three component system protein [Flavobacterium sp. SUN046]MEC4049322.1 ABC-three component system protein [Flavobacterium sp. SUN046]
MINIIHLVPNNKNLIVFIHGFIGGEKTWIKDDETRPFIDLVLNDNKINDNFDIGIFQYHTELLNFFPKAKSLIGLFTNKKKPVNLPINEISRLLESQLRYSYPQYENIILIGHSMGGLVAKRYILDDITTNSTTRVKLYVSLATPHSGSNLATYGKTIINNFQIKDLSPLSDSISAMNDEWVKCKQLPKRLYVQGSYDNIVPKVSSVSVDKDAQEVVYCDEDHFSVITPTGKSVVVDAIITELHNILKEQSIQSITNGERFVDTGQFDEEIFVLKMLMADIHKTLMNGSKQAFFNAEFAIRKLNAQGVNIEELNPLYENIKELYIIEFGHFITGKYATSDALLNAVHEKILLEDKIYLNTLYQPLQALQKFGMLHQLASVDNDVWWNKEDNIKTLDEFTEKLKALK